MKIELGNCVVPPRKKLESDLGVQSMLMHPLDFDRKKMRLPVLVQPKLNGISAIWHGGKQGLYTKDGKRWRNWLPEMLGLMGCSHVLCMELYKHGMSLQEINSAIGVNNIEKTDRAEEIMGFVFDTIRSQNAEDRAEWIKCASLIGPGLRHIPSCACNDEEKLNAAIERNRNNGYEGSIIRYAFAYYTPGKSWVCMKQKNWKDGEFEIVELVEGEGKSAGAVGSMKVRGAGMEFTVGTFRISYEDRQKLWHSKSSLPRVKVQWINESIAGVPLNASVTQILED